MSLVVATEWLLYLSLSLLMGAVILYNVPPKYKASAVVSKRLVLISIAGSIVFSYGPVLSTILIFGQDIGYWTSFLSVMLSFDLGKSWITILAVGLLLYGLIYYNDVDQDPLLSKLAFLLVTVLIIAYAKASHAASLAPTAGFIYHFTHLWLITIWGGLLFTVSWGAKDTRDWLSFIKWYTPLSIVCITLILISGFLTMSIDIASPFSKTLISTVSQYKNGLASNYGQALLIKHLFIIPLLLFAGMNAFYTRHQLKNGTGYQALPVARTESIFLIIIFLITAFMGQQAPPHEVTDLIKQEGFSPLFHIFYSGASINIFPLHVAWSSISFLFLGTAVMLLLITLLSVITKIARLMAFILSFAFVASAYISMMLSLN